MKKLFDEVQFKDLTLKNRFFRSGTWIAKAEETGFLTDEFYEYYTKLASQSNLGFATVGYARVLENEKANAGMVGLWDDKFIDGLKKLTDIFHKNNVPVGIQLAMGGSQVHYRGKIEWKVLAPTAVDLYPRRDEFGNKIVYKANEITVEEIKEVIEAFANASLRVKKAGFDMVQLHAGHGYFLSQWMNKEINTREDEYGKDRTKFIIELYDAVREKVGDDFKVGIKLNSEEKAGDHSNHIDMLNLCKELDKRGIDLIEVSGNMPSRPKVATVEEESFFKDFATKLTKEVSAKVMLTGGNKTFKNIEKVLQETDVDFIGLSRPLISEVDLIKKWEKDNDYKTRCVSCNYCHKDTNKCVFDVKK